MPRVRRRVTPEVGAPRHGKTPSRYKTKRFDHGGPIAKIDTRPMVFVAFLLAVMMLFPASQVRTHALLVDTPSDWRMGSYPETIPHMAITISADGTIRLDKEIIKLGSLAHAIASRGDDWPTVAVYPDPAASYESVALVLAEVTKAGVDPSEICLLELDRYRDFGKASLIRVMSIGPSGCDMLYSMAVA